jgi:ferredoxin-NADP reductase
MNSGEGSPLAGRRGQELFPVTVTGLSWLTKSTFEIRFQRPARFEFVPGQKIGVVHKGIYRDYSLISSVQDQELAICVRLVSNGELSPVLAEAKTGDPLQITPAFGFFLYQPSRRPAVFVATGTGIAPFVAFVRAGAKHYHLLHGVRSAAEFYYRELLAPPAKSYTPCLSDQEDNDCMGYRVFHGRVTDFLEQKLSPGSYDFYLCGRGEMVRDATHIIDRRFPGARVFSEPFF